MAAIRTPRNFRVIFYIIIFEVNIVAKQKQPLLVTIFLYFYVFIDLNSFTAPCPTAVPASLEKRAKLFVVVRYFVLDVGVKVKLIEFKSGQVNLL